jgi:hypothetical protein
MVVLLLCSDIKARAASFIFLEFREGKQWKETAILWKFPLVSPPPRGEC